MIHFVYLVGFAFFAGIVLGAISPGTYKDKLYFGMKIFAQFTLVSLGLAWLFYFLPW